MKVLHTQINNEGATFLIKIVDEKIKEVLTDYGIPFVHSTNKKMFKSTSNFDIKVEVKDLKKLGGNE